MADHVEFTVEERASLRGRSLKGAAKLHANHKDLQELQHENCAHSLDITAVSSKWNDVWALMIFWVMVIGLVVVAAMLGPQALSSPLSTLPESTASPSKQRFTQIIVRVVFCSVGFGFLAAVGLVTLVSCLRGRIVKPGVIVVGVILAVATVLSFVFTHWIMGVIFIILTALYAFMLYLAWDVLKFSEALLDTACQAVSEYRSMWVAATAFLIVQLIWIAVWIAAFAGINQALNITGAIGLSTGTEDQHISSAGGYALLVMLFFFFVWGALQWGAVVHFVATAVAGHWCLNSAPTNVVCGSIYRAMGPSFGTLSFGTMIYAIVEGLRMVLSILRRQAAEDGNCCAFIALCCLECCVQCIADILDRLNYLVFAVAALTGTSYCEGVRKVEQIFGNSTNGWLALFQHDWTHTAILGMELCLVALTSAAATATAILTMPGIGYHPSRGEATFLFFLAFFVAMLLCSIFVAVFTSSVVGVFFCFADAPYDCFRNRPTEFQPLSAAFFDSFFAKLDHIDKALPPRSSKLPA